MLPVVAALKQRPEARTLIPPDLWKYLDDPILVSGWYPERDYWALISALVKTIDPGTVGGDVWRYFARFSAQRDIGGKAARAEGNQKTAAGVYRGFAGMTEPRNFFVGVTRLWSQYHDSGRMELSGGCTRENAVFMRLSGFAIPIEGFVRLQGYYVEEYGRLVGLDILSSVTRSTLRKDAFCEWKFRLTRTREIEAYVASLPAVSP